MANCAKNINKFADFSFLQTEQTFENRHEFAAHERSIQSSDNSTILGCDTN